MHPQVDFYLIDNGATPDISQVMEGYGAVSRHEENIYVNPAWNEAMKYFMAGDWDVLIIANSDLWVALGWYEALEQGMAHPLTVCSPSSRVMEEDALAGAGVPGHCICLTREAVEIVYPIPSELRVWFGDSWIYGWLAGIGWTVRVLKDMRAGHQASQSVAGIPGIHDIIEEDKAAWAALEKPWLSTK